jgi:hypothetical protein
MLLFARKAHLVMSLRSKSKKTRAAVNRANAQKSTGPKTEQGKTVSSQNSFKHGLYSRAVIIPGEDRAAFEALRAELTSEHRPVGLTEELLVNEIAQHYWRMKRYRTLEAQMYKSKGVNEDGSTALDTANLVQCIDLGLFTSIQRALNSAERGFYKALKTLREMQKARGFVPAQAQSAAVKPTAFPVKQRSAAEEWAEFQAATGMNEAQLTQLFRGAA